MAAININHNEGSITTDDGKVLQITKNGAVKIGSGTYLEELDGASDEVREEYEGCIRYNQEKAVYEYCDGHIWKEFKTGKPQDSGIVWSIIF